MKKLSGEDPHRKRAAIHFGIPESEVTEEQRRVGKILNFAIFYGMSTKKLSEMMGKRLPKGDEMISHTMEELEQEVAFVIRAKAAFEKDPTMATYSEPGVPEPGGLLAMRWGLLNRGIVVIRIDPDKPVKNYVGVIEEE